MKEFPLKNYSQNKNKGKYIHNPVNPNGYSSSVDNPHPDQTFVCEHCGRVVPGSAPGTENRNHCPYCLWSLHVDLRIGDRSSGCRGQMEPIAISVRYKDEWAIVHRCQKCQVIRTNRIAGDDNELGLLAIAVRPLAKPPFPLDLLNRIASENRADRVDE
jgi:hypothetical protein